MTKPKFELNRDTHADIELYLEDCISYMCDEYEISSELAWILTEVCAIKKQAKLEQLQATL